MNSFIIDTSVAAKWFFREKGSRKAEGLLEQFSFFFVPDLFVIELDAVITKKVRKREITTDEALVKSQKSRKLPYKIVEYAEISRLALELSVSLPITLYDATYVEKHGVVYTADQKMVNELAYTSLNDYLQSIWDLE